MKRIALATVLLAMCWTAEAQSYTPESFVSQLRRLEAGMDQGDTLASAELPQQWTVSTDTRTYSISSQPLRNFLDQPDRQSARRWLAKKKQKKETKQKNMPHD